jgi:hypothetical protein
MLIRSKKVRKTGKERERFAVFFEPLFLYLFSLSTVPFFFFFSFRFFSCPSSLFREDPRGIGHSGRVVHRPRQGTDRRHWKMNEKQSTYKKKKRSGPKREMSDGGGAGGEGGETGGGTDPRPRHRLPTQRRSTACCAFYDAYFFFCFLEAKTRHLAQGSI